MDITHDIIDVFSNTRIREIPVSINFSLSVSKSVSRLTAIILDGVPYSSQLCTGEIERDENLHFGVDFLLDMLSMLFLT